VLGNVYSRAECLERARAEEHYIQSLELGQRLGMRPLTAHCHFGLTKLYRETNKREQAVHDVKCICGAVQSGEERRECLGKATSAETNRGVCWAQLRRYSLGQASANAGLVQDI
jgi:hypothetical protein